MTDNLQNLFFMSDLNPRAIIITHSHAQPPKISLTPSKSLKLEKPLTPKKAGFVFVGWKTSAAVSTPCNFSFGIRTRIAHSGRILFRIQFRIQCPKPNLPNPIRPNSCQTRAHLFKTQFGGHVLGPRRSPNAVLRKASATGSASSAILWRAQNEDRRQQIAHVLYIHGLQPNSARVQMLVF